MSKRCTNPKMMAYPEQCKGICEACDAYKADPDKSITLQTCELPEGEKCPYADCKGCDCPLGVYNSFNPKVVEIEPTPTALQPPQWTKEWPTEPGYYWFYGRRFRISRTEEPTEMSFVEVFLSANKTPVYICNGNFLYKREASEGWWTRAELPDPPKEAKDWRPRCLNQKDS